MFASGALLNRHCAIMRSTRNAPSITTELIAATIETGTKTVTPAINPTVRWAVPMSAREAAADWNSFRPNQKRGGPKTAFDNFSTVLVYRFQTPASR